MAVTVRSHRRTSTKLGRTGQGRLHPGLALEPQGALEVAPDALLAVLHLRLDQVGRVGEHGLLRKLLSMGRQCSPEEGPHISTTPYAHGNKPLDGRNVHFDRTNGLSTTNRRRHARLSRADRRNWSCRAAGNGARWVDQLL